MVPHVNDHSRNPNWRYCTYSTMYKAYCKGQISRDIPSQNLALLYLVPYLHFRIRDFPLAMICRKPPAMNSAKSLFQKLLCCHVDSTPVLWFGRHAIGVSPENLHVNPRMCSIFHKKDTLNVEIPPGQEMLFTKTNDFTELPPTKSEKS